MSYPRVIVYADLSDFGLAARAAAHVLKDGYQWPEDGYAVIGFGEGYADCFSVRRNKSGVTVYGPDRAHPTTPGKTGEGE